MQNWSVGDTILLAVLIVSALSGALMTVRDSFCDKRPNRQTIAELDELLRQAKKEKEERENPPKT